MKTLSSWLKMAAVGGVFVGLTACATDGVYVSGSYRHNDYYTGYSRAWRDSTSPYYDPAWGRWSYPYPTYPYGYTYPYPYRIRPPYNHYPHHHPRPPVNRPPVVRPAPPAGVPRAGTPWRELPHVQHPTRGTTFR